LKNFLADAFHCRYISNCYYVSRERDRHMFVAELFDALLIEVRGRVRNGEWTERGLAKHAGVSQAHLHNVLKGARPLTPAVADRVLRALKLSVLDVADCGASGGRHLDRA
jgi:hypothetical protein